MSLVRLRPLAETDVDNILTWVNDPAIVGNIANWTEVKAQAATILGIQLVDADVLNVPLLLTDEYGHVTMLNRAAEKLLGYREEDVVGKPTTALYDPEDLAAARAELRTPPGADPLLELTRSGLPGRQNWTLLTRDGERRPVTLNMTAIGDRNAPAGFVLAITPRRAEWEPLVSQRSSSDRLLLDLDDAETRTLRWQVGGSGLGRKR